jgi:hypothetical protein
MNLRRTYENCFSPTSLAYGDNTTTQIADGQQAASLTVRRSTHNKTAPFGAVLLDLTYVRTLVTEVRGAD